MTFSCDYTHACFHPQSFASFLYNHATWTNYTAAYLSCSVSTPQQGVWVCGISGSSLMTVRRITSWPPLQWCRLPKIQAFCHVATHYFGQFSALLKLLLFFNFTSGPKSNKGYACRDSGLLSSPMTSSMGSFMLLLGLLRVLEHYSSSKLIE